MAYTSPIIAATIAGGVYAIGVDVHTLIIAEQHYAVGRSSVDARSVTIHSFSGSSTMNGDVRSEFEQLAQQWRQETSFHSSPSRRFTHTAYQRILAMGKDAIPHILKELSVRPDHWFYALKFIAGEDVAKHALNFDEARTVWLEWGYANDYL